MQTVKIIQDTILKRRALQASDLPDDQKQEVEAGKELAIASFALDRQHIRVAFADASFKGFNTWYCFAEHVQILKDGKVVLPPPEPPLRTKLQIPYKSQLDNQENPTGSCNVTSIAMCLEFLGAKRKQQAGQFEDELYRYALDHGLSRHDPHDLAVIVEAYGCRDDFRTDATVPEVKAWLAAGKPIVTHDWLSAAGHIIVLVGYDEYGFLCHDHYGEWNDWGYDTGASGDGVRYSYEMIERLCMADGQFWIHFISKK